MRKRLWTLITICMFTVSVMFAQQKVTGTVIESETGEPVVGASVHVKGSLLGAASDINGKFTIDDVPNTSKTLVVSYIGMTTKEVTIKPNVKIYLDSDSKSLNDVVVTALGIKRSAKSLGYSATKVDGDVLSETRSNDIMSNLAGKVAGLQINPSSSPGSSTSVVIRGYSSLAGDNQPIYIIDGVPLNNGSIDGSGLNDSFDFGTGAQAVNPDDIEDITVLKGAAATALYGSRAANGVIMITTKQGKKHSKGVGVEYNGGASWESVLRLPQMQNDFGMGWYGDKTDDENGSWGPAFDGSTLKYGSVYDNSQQIKSYVPIKNNIKDFFDTGFKYQNSVSFDGVSDDNRSKYFVSFSQIHEDGIIPTNADSYNKYTFSARGSHKIKDLTISTSLNYTYNKNKNVLSGQGESSMYNAVMQSPRDVSFVELKNLDNPFATPGYYYTPYGITNPYWILENYKNEYEQDRFYGKLQLDYDFLKYFKVTYRASLDNTAAQYSAGEPNMEALFGDTYLGQNGASTFTGATGSVTERTIRRREFNHDLFVTFDMPVDDDWHVNAVAGANGYEYKVQSLYANVTNLTIPTWYNLSNSAEKPTTTTSTSHKRMTGLYANAEVSWREMVFINMCTRTDWSSTLPNAMSYTYPGVTGSFIFSEILNPEVKKVITFGKFRAAWGKTGSDADPYQTLSSYTKGSASSSGWGTSKFPLNGINAFTVSNTLGNMELSPVMTKEMELGLNMAFLNNRISFDLAYYNKITDKQIFTLDMDASTGYTAQVVNFGKVRNRGIELLINGTPIKTRDFQWDLRLNYTKNKSKVLSLPEGQNGETEIYGFTGGTGLWAIEGEELGIYKAYTSQKTEDGQVIVDSNGLPVSTSDVQIIGSMNHKYTLGFGTTFRYKSISFSADFDYRHGGLMYSRTRNIADFTGNAIQTAYNGRNPWIVPNSVVATTDADGNTVYVENTTALTPTNIYKFWDNGGIDMDAGDLISRTFLKLRSVTLSWNLPKRWLAGTVLADATVSMYGENLFIWTPSSNTYTDPELSNLGNDLEGQFGEYSANPSCRKFGFNINVKF